MPRLLDGMCLLVLEDDYFAACEMERMVKEAGGTVLGPVGRLEQAFDLSAAERLDAAILDVKLNGHDSLQLADDLIAKGVPVIFATGYSADSLPERFANEPRITKPVTRIAFERAMKQLFPKS